jgi:cytochrome c oxidase subunit 2
MYNFIIISLFNFNTNSNSTGFKDPVSSIMENIIVFHDVTMLILIIISIIVFWLIITIIDHYVTFYSFSAIKINNSFLIVDKFYIYILASVLNYKRAFKNDKILEGLWTLFPAIILIFISMPSFYILYLSEESIETILTIKAIGFQWYWTFDYGDLYPLWFDLIINPTKEPADFLIESYMEPTEFLKLAEGQYRFLETDSFLLLPTKIHLRLIVTSMDTLHSFTIPALGIKLDAIPGRLNKIDFLIFKIGVYFGQCSEICGIGHGFMPISIYAISLINFLIGDF